MAEKNVQGMTQALKLALGNGADEIVPWFYEHMPEYYFRTHGEEEQLAHLQAIVSGKVLSEQQGLSLKSPSSSRVTHILPGGDTQTLLQSVASLAKQRIHTARLYSSDDLFLRLDTYLLGEQARSDVNGKYFSAAEQELLQSESISTKSPQAIKEFLSAASEDYVEKFEPVRAARHFDMYNRVAGTEGVHVSLESQVWPNSDRIMVSMTQPPQKGILLSVLKILVREGLVVSRAYGDEFAHADAPVLVMSFYVARGEQALEETSPRWQRIARQLRLVKWFAFHDLEPLAEENSWEIGQVMLMQAACEFAHQFLIRRDMYKYTSAVIARSALRHREILGRLLAFFETKFDPDFSGDRTLALEKIRGELRDALRDVNDDVDRKVLGYILRFFHYVLRTNYYLPNKLGLSFRMDPNVLPRLALEEPPFGFYCFHGPHSFAFQVRYRDMARGGVRVVPTRSKEHFELESNRLFDEVTKLAWAQQFKNKDIPEGGSKAVILMEPDGEIDLAVKSMTDSLLDLMVTDEQGQLPSEIVDYLNRDEIIYLGPDENITPKHIQWIVDRAAKRGYKWPGAIMSSKPKAGISHKEYGVTSEGVVVYADEILRSLGIDPDNQPFTVKMTGGPAGDVASNVVKILLREYGANARILAMTDGHGAVYDPDGLDHKELMRLIDDVRRTHEFDPAKLKGQGAFVLSADTPEGVRMRDDLHNIAVADLFIPSGGRPDTINEKNWKRFLLPDGTPSAKAVIEGANIFISAGARAKFEECGVICVPGPSANKTGVICSSYEILAGLALNEDEFIEIKDDYVRQLLDILRLRARSEARVLLREHKFGGARQSLTEISYALSSAINSLSGTIADMLEEDDVEVAADPVLKEIVLAYCPAILAEKYGERLLQRIPKAHQFALLGASIASGMLYNEGLEWVTAVLGTNDVRQFVRAYLGQGSLVASLLDQVQNSKISQSPELVQILESCARKVLTMKALEQ